MRAPNRTNRGERETKRTERGAKRKDQQGPPKHNEERNRTKKTTRRTDRNTTQQRSQESSRVTHQGDQKTTKGTEGGTNRAFDGVVRLILVKMYGNSESWYKFGDMHTFFRPTRRKAFARSFNMFPIMLHVRLMN